MTTVQLLLFFFFVFLEPHVARGVDLYATSYSNWNCANPPAGILPDPPAGPYSGACLSGPVRLSGSGLSSPSYRSIDIRCSPTPKFTIFDSASCLGNVVQTLPGPNGDARGYCVQLLVSDTSYRFFCAPPKQNCLPALRIKRKVCQRRIKQCGSAPYTGLKWTEACRAKGKPVQPAGCRCREYCGYNCKRRCTKDKDCVWNKNLNACAHKSTPDRPADSGCRSWY